MARKLRLEERSIVAFAKALSEDCGRFGWVLHAYFIMDNHFHLAVETPQCLLFGRTTCRGRVVRRRR